MELDPFVVNFGKRFGGNTLRHVDTVMGPARVTLAEGFGRLVGWGVVQWLVRGGPKNHLHSGKLT